MAKTLLSTARHEAAHYAIGRRFGGRARRIVVFEKPSDGVRGYVEWMKRPIIGPMGQVMTTIAGSLAEHLWHGSPEGIVSGADYELLMGIGLTPACVREVWNHTKPIVRSEKSLIWELADELVEKGKVDMRGRK